MRVFRRILQGLLRQLGVISSEKPSLIAFREREQSKAAIVFIHGFGGDTKGTWGQFPEFLMGERRLDGWDVFAIGYPSSLRVDVLGIWEADPDLSLASLSLSTAISVLPLSRYGSIAIIAHSMGGLIAQRAILDPGITPRIGDLLLFGCPSGGLAKALIGADLKRQSRDMAIGSSFIDSLRGEWSRRFAQNIPFSLRAIAGERDEFVPASSSLEPFPAAYQRAVPGNHIEIVKPQAAHDRSVQIVVNTLLNESKLPSPIDSALVAVELRDFARAVTVLLPRADEIDDSALVQLALALEGINRGQEALSLLESQFEARGRPSSDALGALAGRLKRRWLTERVLHDWQRARSLYLRALRMADPTLPADDPITLQGASDAHAPAASEIDTEQAMYHAINVAFLDLMITPQASHIPSHVRGMAERALVYARSARDDHWRRATEADAYAMLGNLTKACEAYSLAVSRAGSPRAVDSMFSQAIRIGERIFGEPGIEAVESAFGVGRNTAPGSLVTSNKSSG
jgi:pimeloyl-ACP methyl ester carboxylesterase